MSDAERAAGLHGVAEALFDHLGARTELLESELRSTDQKRLRAVLGDATFDTAYTAGQRLPINDAIELALADLLSPCRRRG